MVTHDDLVSGDVPALDGWQLKPIDGRSEVAYERTPLIDELPFDGADWPHGLDNLLVRAELKRHTGTKDGYLIVLYESNADRGMLTPIYRATETDLEAAHTLLVDVLRDYDEMRFEAIERGENILEPTVE